MYVETEENKTKMCFHCKQDFEWDQLIQKKKHSDPNKNQLVKLRAVLQIKMRLLEMREKLALKVKSLN